MNSFMNLCMNRKNISIKDVPKSSCLEKCMEHPAIHKINYNIMGIFFAMD